MNQCGRCHLDFGSVAAFDAHRVGKHEYLFAEGLDFDPPVYDGRRCLGVDELEAKGFAQNRRGTWSLTRDLNRDYQGLSAKPQTSQGVS